MAVVQYASIKGQVARVTRLDSLGKWATGTSASAVSSAFVNIGLTANVEEGEDFKVKNAAGDLCINEKDASKLNWFDISAEFCSVDPALFEIMTGMTLLADYSTASVGLEIIESLPNAYFALEIWTKIPQKLITGNQQWVYWLLPMCTNGLIGDYTIENGPMSFTIKANSSANSNWGKGPYNVIWNSASTPGKMLTNVAATAHLRQFATEVTPPTAAAGYVTQSVGWTAPV